MKSTQNPRSINLSHDDFDRDVWNTLIRRCNFTIAPDNPEWLELTTLTKNIHFQYYRLRELYLIDKMMYPKHRFIEILLDHLKNENFNNKLKDLLND